MAQMVVGLSSKHEALSSNPSTTNLSPYPIPPTKVLKQSSYSFMYALPDFC
jgi:hypothetical protein